MAKIVFENLQDKVVTLVIEPWAMAEIVPPGGKVFFEVADDHPPEVLEFALTAEGDPFIAVVSSLVRFHAKGRDWEFRPEGKY